MRLSDGRTLTVERNLPPHLSQALQEALAGLSEAYLDTTHPLQPQLVALWEVEDQIERWILSRE